MKVLLLFLFTFNLYANDLFIDKIKKNCAKDIKVSKENVLDRKNYFLIACKDITISGQLKRTYKKEYEYMGIEIMTKNHQIRLDEYPKTIYNPLYNKLKKFIHKNVYKLFQEDFNLKIKSLINDLDK